MTEVALSQFDATEVILTLECGPVLARGLTPRAASTLVTAVVADAREYQATSSSPALVAVRIAGNMCTPPEAGRSSTTGIAWMGANDPRWKLSSRMSPSGWWRVSFQAMLTVPYRSLTASRGKSLEANRL